MPISGVVITCTGEKITSVQDYLTKTYPTVVEIHGTDDKSLIAAVLETESSEEMERVITGINDHDDVFNVGITYLNTEDEAERMAKGETLPKPVGFRNTAPPLQLKEKDR